MTTCESADNTSLPSYEHFARGKWLIRPQFHIPCVVLSIIIIVVYLFELRVVIKYRRYAPFTSTYFRIWVMQAVADLLSLTSYIVFSFVRNIPSTWSFWIRLNHTMFPKVILIINGAVILSQMSGVSLTSINRYLKLCRPTCNITTRFDYTPTYVFLFLVLIFPFLIASCVLYHTTPIFVYTSGSSVIAQCLDQGIGKMMYSITAPLWCVMTLFVSTICYGKIVQNLSTMSYLKRRAVKTERTLTLLSIPVFLSLWIVFLYYVFIVGAMLSAWKSMYDFLFAHYHLLNLSLSIANPISALFSRDIRGRVFFQQMEFSKQRHTFLS